MVANSDEPLTGFDSLPGEAPLIPEAEISLLVAFDRAVAAHGSRVALVFGGSRPTYHELNAAANNLAHQIGIQGGTPGERVAILTQHDAPAVAAFLAVLKAGCIAVPMNSAHPPSRLRQIIERTDPALIVADAEH